MPNRPIPLQRHQGNRLADYITTSLHLYPVSETSINWFPAQSKACQGRGTARDEITCACLAGHDARGRRIHELLRPLPQQRRARTQPVKVGYT